MGAFMLDDDIYIGSLLEMLNLRFGRYESGNTPDGINEIQAIQKEFRIFEEGRPLMHSLRALGVGGLWNPSMKNRWLDLLNWLDKVDSQTPSLKGGPAIVRELIKHLESEKPEPVYFKAHDSRKGDLIERVRITKGRPVFYMNQDYLVISIPMKPRTVKKQSLKRATRPK